jgi:hypothetical protein
MMTRWNMIVVLCLVVTAGGAGVLHAQTTPAPQEKARVAPSDRTRGETAAVPGVKGVRTIDAINIEGEIAVPQVLFITSRDNRRYRDGLGKTFRLGALDVARSIAMPNRLCVAGSQSPKSPVSLKEE